MQAPSSPPRRRIWNSKTLILSVFLLSLPSLLVADASTSTSKQRKTQQKRSRQNSHSNNNHRLAERIARRLTPRPLQYNATSPTPWPTKQVVHLHHMKTGGTSVNGLMSCGMRRFESLFGTTVPFASLSECSGAYYKKCIDGELPQCTEKIDQASVMTYCAPLFQIHEFGWLRQLDQSNNDNNNEEDRGTGMITVLRNPIDRIWSMYRYQTRGCYKCVPLLKIYQAMDDGTIASMLGCESADNCHGVCLPQLVNHQVRNLLTSPRSEDLTEEEQLKEAIRNLRNEFTVVGLTEELNTTAKMIGHAFPFLAERFELEDQDATFEMEDGLRQRQRQRQRRRQLRHDSKSHGEDGPIRCQLPHDNASPTNNGCGKDGGHLDLPPHPDKETLEAILKHNELDVKLYEKAVHYFQLEKQALGLD